MGERVFTKMKTVNMLVMSFAAVAAMDAVAISGSGTEQDPYLIGDYAALVEFAGKVNGGAGC